MVFFGGVHGEKKSCTLLLTKPIFAKHVEHVWGNQVSCATRIVWWQKRIETMTSLLFIISLEISEAGLESLQSQNKDVKLFHFVGICVCVFWPRALQYKGTWYTVPNKTQPPYTLHATSLVGFPPQRCSLIQSKCFKSLSQFVAIPCAPLTSPQH